MEIWHDESASRHGIPEADSAHAVRNAVLSFDQDAPDDDPTRRVRTVWLGGGRSGDLLEVVGFEAAKGTRVVIIHAMPMRSKYLELLP